MINMRNATLCLCGATLAIALCGTARAETGKTTLDQLEKRVAELEADAAKRYIPKWSNGLSFESPDKEFTYKITGRVFNDWAFFSQDSDLEDEFGNIQDGTEFRAAWMHFSGTLHDNVIFKAGWDFASGDNSLKDTYIGLRNLPVAGTLKVGHYKEPFSLEQLTLNKYITFMERSLSDNFVPSRNTGAMVTNTVLDDRATWAAGVFRDSGKHGKSTGDGKYNVTGRITSVPWYENDGRQLVHVGAGYSRRNPDTLSYKARPESHMAPILVDTDEIDVDGVDLIGGELATVLGPLSLQGEYIHTRAKTNSHSDFGAWYAMASYFITGEHRPYSKANGVFSRVKPKKNFGIGENAGPGAWELAGRVSHIDLDDGAIRGGEMDDVTIALNWYLNPNVRVMCNYIHAEVDNDTYDGDADIFQMRFQIAF